MTLCASREEIVSSERKSYWTERYCQFPGHPCSCYYSSNLQSDASAISKRVETFYILQYNTYFHEPTTKMCSHHSKACLTAKVPSVQTGCQCHTLSPYIVALVVRVILIAYVHIKEA